MAFVQCVAREGLRDSEASVAVKDEAGRSLHLRVERTFLRQEEGKCFLPVGVVGRDPANPLRVLIELPHKADSGASRLWVHKEQLLTPATVTG